MSHIHYPGDDSPLGDRDTIEMSCLLADSQPAGASSSGAPSGDGDTRATDRSRAPKMKAWIASLRDGLPTARPHGSVSQRSYWTPWWAHHAAKFEERWASAYTFDTQMFTRVQRAQLSANDPAFVRGINHAIHTLSPSEELQEHITVLAYAMTEVLQRDETREEQSYRLLCERNAAMVMTVVALSGLAVQLVVSIFSAAGAHDAGYKFTAPIPAELDKEIMPQALHMLGMQDDRQLSYNSLDCNGIETSIDNTPTSLPTLTIVLTSTDNVEPKVNTYMVPIAVQSA